MSRRHVLAHAGWGLGGGLHPMPSGHLRLRHRPESRHVHRQLQRGLLLPCSLRLRHCGAVPHWHVPCNHWRRVVGGLLAVHCRPVWVHCGENGGRLHGAMQRWALLPSRVHQLHVCALPSWSVPYQHGRSCTGQCPAGYYCPAGSSNVTAVPCPAGTNRSTTGGAVVADCSTCSVGWYSAGGSTGCTICAAGRYGAGAMASAACSGPCDPGR